MGTKFNCVSLVDLFCYTWHTMKKVLEREVTKTLRFVDLVLVLTSQSQSTGVNNLAAEQTRKSVPRCVKRWNLNINRNIFTTQTILFLDIECNLR